MLNRDLQSTAPDSPGDILARGTIPVIKEFTVSEKEERHTKAIILFCTVLHIL